MTVSAHFDGKVIVPHEPLELTANQPLIVRTQLVGGNEEPVEESVLTWLAANAIDGDAPPKTGSRILTTEAELWEWLNALSDPTTRAVAAEGYRRAHSDRVAEVVPFEPEPSNAAVGL